MTPYQHNLYDTIPVTQLCASTINSFSSRQRTTSSLYKLVQLHDPAIAAWIRQQAIIRQPTDLVAREEQVKLALEAVALLQQQEVTSGLCNRFGANPLS